MDSFMGVKLAVDQAQSERFKLIITRILAKHPDLASDMDDLIACVKWQATTTK